MSASATTSQRFVSAHIAETAVCADTDTGTDIATWFVSAETGVAPMCADANGRVAWQGSTR